jgi:hypothetical protein
MQGLSAAALSRVRDVQLLVLLVDTAVYERQQGLWYVSGQTSHCYMQACISGLLRRHHTIQGTVCESKNTHPISHRPT